MLYETEAELTDYYNEKFKVIQKQMIDFLSGYETEIDKKLKQLTNKEITKQEYRNYVFGLLSSKKGQELLDKITDEIAIINKNAVEFSERRLKEIYIENYNSTVKSIGESIIENWI